MAAKAGDPWSCDENQLTTKEVQNSTVSQFEDKFELFQPLSDSETYIQSLEKRLAKIKGKREPTSKDVLKCFSEVRQDYISNFVQPNDSNEEFHEAFGDAYAAETENGALLNAVSYMERRLFPEKQALSTEELQHLLEADMLAKMTAELASVEQSQKPESEVDLCR